jgi:hypothetical protein
MTEEIDCQHFFRGYGGLFRHGGLCEGLAGKIGEQRLKAGGTGNASRGLPR